MTNYIGIEKDEVGIVKDGSLHCIIKKTLQYEMLEDLERLYPDSRFQVVENNCNSDALIDDDGIIII